MPIERITILGTGLIGASVGLALKAEGFAGEIAGWDPNAADLTTAREIGAIDLALPEKPSMQEGRVWHEDVSGEAVVLCGPVLSILDWLHALSETEGSGMLITDVGSTKEQIASTAQSLYTRREQGSVLPGHPMAGKESGGAALADAELFRGATWIFTPLHVTTPLEQEWRGMVAGMGATILDMEPKRHDELCAWVSHMPQFVSTAMSALLEETFGSDPELRAIGGRALREMTRLGASPYNMWRDVAHTNTEHVAKVLLALEQRLQHLRENLRTPELREEFTKANRFREPR